MKLNILLLSTLFFITINTESILGQGCVAIRPTSCSMVNGLGILPKGGTQFTSNYQYFKSYRHFRGDVEEHERIENKTQVENFSHAVDLGVQYAITSKFSVGFNMLILFYKRTSLYEHYGNSLDRNPNQERFETKSAGIGDMRITGSFWLFDPNNLESKGNLSLGTGIKLPTGNSNVQGDFHKLSTIGKDSIVNKAVDQSIQLGDGGWGIIVQFQGVRKLFKSGILYANGFYLANPMTQNKTISKGKLIGADPIIAYHSIPDQFSIRAGFNYNSQKATGLSISLGARFEGIPSQDLIGSSNGYRRPGNVVSIEPGISYNHQQLSLGLTVPTAIYRNRVKSVYDLADPLGKRHGDAAFADYLVNFTFAYRLLNNVHHEEM